MPRSCAVTLCRHRQGNGCSFFQFPNNIERCRIWIQALGNRDFLGLPLEILSKYRFVCSCHFNDADYTKKLKVGAIPVKFSTDIKPLTDSEIMEFPPSAVKIIPSSRILMPTSELPNLIQPKKHGILNPIFVKNPETKELEQLPSPHNDIPMSIKCDSVKLKEEIMQINSRRLTKNDSSLQASSPRKSSISLNNIKKELDDEDHHFAEMDGIYYNPAAVHKQEYCVTSTPMFTENEDMTPPIKRVQDCKTESQIFGDLVAKKISKYSAELLSAVKDDIMQVLVRADKIHYS